MEKIRSNVPLAPLTTLELGGEAAYFVEVDSIAELRDSLLWARTKGLPLAILGGGSNVVIADSGFSGLVIKPNLRGVSFVPDGETVLAAAGAGEPWDLFVKECVARDLAGIECLSGIPGLVGATPIQNVGAYGQEVSHTIVSVDAISRTTFEERTLKDDECNFSYRHSVFKQNPDAWMVVRVTYRLRPRGAPFLAYKDLQQKFSAHVLPSVSEVRDAVIEIRRSKSMVIESGDENRRSLGSFFLNPYLSKEVAGKIFSKFPHAPSWEVDASRVKFSAAWLIENAGFHKGMRKGAVGISSRHSLALVHHGGGTTRELIEFARSIQEAVYATFGVVLTPEPTFVGFQSLPLHA